MGTELASSETREIRWGVVGLIAGVTLVGILGPKLLWMNAGYTNLVGSWPIDVQFLIHPVLRMVLVLVGWLLVLRLKPVGASATMGLVIGWVPALKGIGVGLVCTLPMLFVGLMSSSYTPSHYEILYTGLSPGLTEEIFYRAFMFGLLVQVGRCPMWATAVITGIVFGLAHVDLTPNAGETIMGQLGPWIGMIALGGFMYAWLYWESGWNLWLVIALHTGMNLWWDMFDLTLTPLGNWGATGSRIVSVGLVVLCVVGLRVFGKRPAATIEHEYTTIDP
ncbi:MAG: CPBP family intramembrane glutamic endopeptidase [Phycisphaerales bacterium JB047]